jgi:hypothetical protein
MGPTRANLFGYEECTGELNSVQKYHLVKYGRNALNCVNVKGTVTWVTCLVLGVQVVGVGEITKHRARLRLLLGDLHALILRKRDRKRLDE